MNYFIKALLIILMSIVFVGLLPTAHGAPDDTCQPIYHSETMDGEHEVYICITKDELVYQFSKIDGEMIDAERFNLSDVSVKSYYVNAFDTQMYEIIFGNEETSKRYGLLAYPSESKISISDDTGKVITLEMNQGTEINNLWNLVK